MLDRVRPRAPPPLALPDAASRGRDAARRRDRLPPRRGGRPPRGPRRRPRRGRRRRRFVTSAASSATKEACRDARGTVLVESIAKDLRYGARSLLRQPAYAVPAVLTIALGHRRHHRGLRARRRHPRDAAAVPGAGTAGDRQRRVSRRRAGRGAAHAVDDGRRRLRRRSRVHAGRRRPGGARHRRARVRRAVRRPRRHAGSRPHLPRRRGSGGPRRRRAPERRAVAHALRGRPRRRRPVDRRRRPVARDRRGAAGQRRSAVAADAESGCRWRSNPRDTARYWAGDFMPLVARLRPGVTAAKAQAELRLFQRDVRQQFPWTMPDDWNRDLVVECRCRPRWSAVSPRGSGSCRRRRWWCW